MLFGITRVINFGKENGGASRDRTDDLIRARDALSQLSYGPTLGWVDYQKVETKKVLFLFFNLH